MMNEKNETLMKVFREELGMSQRELAKQMLIADSTISMWERRRNEPVLSSVYKMAEIFHVSPIVLLDDFAGKSSLATWTNKGEYWECSCGLKWKLNQGTPKENEMRFCPKCAGFIVEGEE